MNFLWRWNRFQGGDEFSRGEFVWGWTVRNTVIITWSMFQMSVEIRTVILCVILQEINHFTEFIILYYLKSLVNQFVREVRSPRDKAAYNEHIWLHQLLITDEQEPYLGIALTEHFLCPISWAMFKFQIQRVSKAWRVITDASILRERVDFYVCGTLNLLNAVSFISWGFSKTVEMAYITLTTDDARWRTLDTLASFHRGKFQNR